MFLASTLVLLSTFARIGDDSCNFMLDQAALFRVSAQLLPLRPRSPLVTISASRSRVPRPPVRALGFCIPLDSSCDLAMYLRILLIPATHACS